MKNSTINLRISSDLKTQVVNKAKAYNISISEYTIEALKDKLEGKSNSPQNEELIRSIGKFSNLVSRSKNNISDNNINNVCKLLDNINTNIINLYIKGEI
ncbi:MAG: hypothetical protein ACI4VF_09155 [Lachnospirales bacterium]